MWKIADIYPDYLQLDDTRVPRPFYMSYSQWEKWCENAISDLRDYDAGYEDGVKSCSDYEFTERDLHRSEENSYDQAIADIRGDIQNFINYHLECSSLGEKEAAELGDKLWAIVT